jgi:hypothetical protein
MRISYTFRSSFLETIIAALDELRGCPRPGNPLQVSLSEQGYDGEVLVDISVEHDDSFAADWESSDETRFPARIRAAATALRDRGCYGRFLIVHKQGELTINRVS